ncbi:MAG: GNAT family N-acetyltransferase [Anaerolineales bacterium]|nr:GNAT family N-acetyltransferase [Anaerolineales bacterium]
MNTTLFTGSLLRLTAPYSLAEAETMARWTHDSEFARLLDSGANYPLSAPDLIERYSDFKPEVAADNFLFFLRPLAEETFLGFMTLEDIMWRNGNAWVGIGLGERAYWGRGYGTEAMRLISRYAFAELGLHRLSLTVFEYNSRAIRSYQKAGFVEEGRFRGYVAREGRRWDLVFMGLLREDWLNVRRNA